MMATPKTQPFLSPGRQTWNAPVTNWEGKRSNKSLGTKDVSEARAICRELNDLAKSQLLPDDPALSLISPIAYKLYYDREKFFKFTDNTSPIVSPLHRDEANAMLAELVALRQQVKELQGYKDRYEALANSLEGRRLKSEQDSPTLGEVEDAYILSVANLNRKGILQRIWLAHFIQAMGRDTRIASITPGQIASFIADEAAAYKGDASRAQKTRALTSRFYTWAAITYGIVRPMDQVPTSRNTAQHDIQWHSLEDVERVLAGLDVYWRALVGTLAYAGLSAHELRGLQSKDLIEVKGRRFLRVTPSEERSLKTHKRRRNVAISKRLEPLLDAHIKAMEKKKEAAKALANEDAKAETEAEPTKEEPQYLFPSIAERGKTEIWHPDGLTRHLGEHLPEGMNALSLRRTFGSLLIRSGKSAEEVAAAMGNSAAMVHTHYGRILGGEVDIDF
ncbi:MAG: Phage integrase family [Verrucomicrobiota bacterium]|jgi:integrase